MKIAPLLPREAWLDELARQLQRVRAKTDPEAVHRLRVAAGRLSVWLELGGRRALHDDLRALRRSAAHVRDLDVVRAREGKAAWTQVLADERSEEASRLRQALAGPRPEIVIGALALVDDPDPVDVRAALQRLKRRVQGAGERLEHENDTSALHRLRRRVRRLRYALDWMGAESEPLKKLQEDLGTLNDMSVELSRLERHPEVHEVEERCSAVREELAPGRKRALESWRALRPLVGSL